MMWRVIAVRFPFLRHRPPPKSRKLAHRLVCLSTADVKPAERDLWLSLGQAYAGRPTVTLNEFLRDFMCGRHGQPMKRKTALNKIYANSFPVQVHNERILVRDIASWLYQIRTNTT